MKTPLLGIRQPISNVAVPLRQRVTASTTSLTPLQYGQPLLHLLYFHSSRRKRLVLELLLKKRYNDHTETIFKELSILLLHDLITVFNLYLFHAYVFSYIPTAYMDTWQMIVQFRDIPNY
jgi:hypothetical protein